MSQLMMRRFLKRKTQHIVCLNWNCHRFRFAHNISANGLHRHVPYRDLRYLLKSVSSSQWSTPLSHGISELVATQKSTSHVPVPRSAIQKLMNTSFNKQGLCYSSLTYRNFASLQPLSNFKPNHYLVTFPQNHRRTRVGRDLKDHNPSCRPTSSGCPKSIHSLGHLHGWSTDSFFSPHLAHITLSTRFSLSK